MEIGPRSIPDGSVNSLVDLIQTSEVSGMPSPPRRQTQAHPFSFSSSRSLKACVHAFEPLLEHAKDETFIKLSS